MYKISYLFPIIDKTHMALYARKIILYPLDKDWYEKDINRLLDAWSPTQYLAVGDHVVLTYVIYVAIALDISIDIIGMIPDAIVPLQATRVETCCSKLRKLLFQLFWHFAHNNLHPKGYSLYNFFFISAMRTGLIWQTMICSITLQYLQMRTCFLLLSSDNIIVRSEMCNLDLSTVNFSIARAKIMQSWSNISKNIGDFVHTHRIGWQNWRQMQHAWSHQHWIQISDRFMCHVKMQVAFDCFSEVFGIHVWALWPRVRLTGNASSVSVTSGELSLKYWLNGNETESDETIS